jgi:hypothetical protein
MYEDGRKLIISLKNNKLKIQSIKLLILSNRNDYDRI